MSLEKNVTLVKKCHFEKKLEWQFHFEVTFSISFFPRNEKREMQAVCLALGDEEVVAQIREAADAAVGIDGSAEWSVSLL